VRYSHVLNPKTGWSVPDAPHTVSVAATTCNDVDYGDVAGGEAKGVSGITGSGLLGGLGSLLKTQGMF